MSELYPSYLKVLERIRRHEPESLILHAVDVMHEQYHGGVEGLRYYRPWEILLAVQWTLQEATWGCQVRVPATRKDVHEVINLVFELEKNIQIGEGPDAIFSFMRRMAFQQFSLQEGPTAAAMTRQLLLFNGFAANDPFQLAFKEETGLTFKETFAAGYTLYVIALASKRALILPADLNHWSGHQRESLVTLVRSLTWTLPELHEWLSADEVKRIPVSRQRIPVNPLIDAPLFMMRDGRVISYYPALLMRSLESLIYRTLRRIAPPNFGRRFGLMFEDYLARCLDCAQVAYEREDALKRRVGNQSKCVDFLIKEQGCDVFVEAKGMEMSVIGQVASDTEYVIQSISPIIDAVRQGLAMRCRVDALDPPKPSPFRETMLIVVTLSDLNLGPNSAVEQMFAPRLAPRLEKDFGSPLPIPFRNIFFISVYDFEMLMELVRLKKVTIESALRFARDEDSGLRSQRLHFRQHLRVLSERIELLPMLKKVLEELNAQVMPRP